MKQEDRQLLLKDLSARLPYGVICRVEFKDSEGWKTQNMLLKGVLIDEYYFSTDAGSIYSKEFKPYLRPLSSMTEEEKKEYFSFIGGQEPYDWDFSAYPIEYKYIYEWDIKNYIKFVNAHHLDYNGLIPKCLAIEVTEENNPYEKN